MLIPRTALELRGYLTRLVSVFGMLEAIDRRQLANLAPPTPDNIASELRSRPVVFPEVVLTELQAACSRRNFIARMGVADLFIVRTEWVAYEAGEIAHIENVIGGERKRRSLVRTDETEQTTTDETITMTTNVQDSQTTDRFEQQDEAQSDSRLAIQVEGQVDTTGQYGPTKVDTHLGGSLDYSIEETTRRATTTARETVTRAVTRTEQRVREERVRRTLTRVVETDRHDLSSDVSLSAIYRWVDKIQRYQLFRFPNRLLVEFLIPEPAAWVRWLQKQNPPQVDATNPAPFVTGSPPHPITADDITEENYKAFAATYEVQDLDLPGLTAAAVRKPTLA